MKWKVMYREKNGKRWYNVKSTLEDTWVTVHDSKRIAQNTANYYKAYSPSRTFKVVKVTK